MLDLRCCTQAFSSCREGGYSSLGCSASRCGGFFRCAAQALDSRASVDAAHTGSVVVTHGLSCSTGIWDLPGPGIETVSPALAGGFLSNVPPRKSC